MYERFHLKEENYQVKCDHLGKVSINIAGVNREIPIGNVSRLYNGSFRYWKKAKIANVFKKNDSWGINHHIYSNLGPEGEIDLFVDDGTTYHLKKSDIKPEDVQYLYFKTLGYEKQIFIPRDMWKRTE